MAGGGGEGDQKLGKFDLVVFMVIWGPFGELGTFPEGVYKTLLLTRDSFSTKGLQVIPITVHTKVTWNFKI